MKAITLHQPWAQLTVTRQPVRVRPHRVEGGSLSCDYCNRTFTFNMMRDQGPYECSCERARAARNPPMVKWIETRSWPAPKALIGQRLAIHASAKSPAGPESSTRVGPWRVWMTGARDVRMSTAPNAPDIVLPLGVVVGSAVLTACVPMVDAWPHMPTACLFVGRRVPHHMTLWPDATANRPGIDVSDQLPFGDFAPGRWAWLLTDAAPTTERCPACWGAGSETVLDPDHGYAAHVELCPACRGQGRCDPIRARGFQRVWEWTP